MVGELVFGVLMLGEQILGGAVFGELIPGERILGGAVFGELIPWRADVRIGVCRAD